MSEETTTRRRFLGVTAAGLAGLAAWRAFSAGRTDARPGRTGEWSPPGLPEASGRVHELRRTAAPTEIELGPLGRRTIWTYDGSYPGPEIRVREGDTLRVTIENRLSEGTTVHWHGIPVPNPMDGVPNVTQAPIAAGDAFVYEFTAGPSGSYMYHSHQGLQLDRGLHGAFVVEERSPHITYDREYTLVLDDLLRGEPPSPNALTGGMMGRGMMRRGMMGRGGGGGVRGMSGAGVPEYEAFLMNGRPPADPPVFEVRKGDRVRLRLLNPSGATTFQLALAGHRMAVTHSDGRPVRPVLVDTLQIGMGERYDVLVDAEEPGVWALLAAPLQGGEPARAVLRYSDARATRAAEPWPGTLQGGRMLALADLHAIEPLPPDTSADRKFDLPLSGGMMSSRWTIGGQTHPEAEPLVVEQGEVVEFRMTNRSMGIHPMHLHGHFFRVGDAWKDTVLVPPHMGRVSLQFLADNPGNWFFHCHNAYHMEAGMARVVRYG